METLDWTNHILTKDSLAGLKDCEIIVKKEQFDELELKVVRVGYNYISHLAILFADAELRNIRFIKGEKVEENV